MLREQETIFYVMMMANLSMSLKRPASAQSHGKEIQSLGGILILMDYKTSTLLMILKVLTSYTETIGTGLSLTLPLYTCLTFRGSAWAQMPQT